MFKRLFAIGVALAVAFSFSLPVFALDTDELDLSFPFYGRTRIRQAGTQLYYSSVGSPISSDSKFSLSGTDGNVIIDFYPLSAAFRSQGGTEFSFNTYYTDWTLDQNSRQRVYYSTNGEIQYIEPPFSDISADTVAHQNTVSLTQLSDVTAKTMQAGSYVLEGFLEFPSGSYGSLDAWNQSFNGFVGLIVTDSGSFNIDFPFADFTYWTRDSKERINFKVSLDIPYTGEYQRFYLQFNGRSSSPIKGITGFSVSTGNIEYQSASTTLGLSSLIGNWFSSATQSIKSGFYTLGHLITSNRDDAAQADESADHEAVSEAQSQVSEIESFESSLNSSITQSVSNIDFTVPSSFGAALGVVSFIFGSFFSDLGGYQVVITIPLILGIMLILIGRGTLALGRVISSNTRAQRDFERTADRPVKGHKDWS